MAGPSRAAPPMPDPFDPAEFDAPPPADPGADYRALPAAMRQAGADGIAQPSAALAQRLGQDARPHRSEEHTSELQSLMVTSNAVFPFNTHKQTQLYESTLTKS